MKLLIYVPLLTPRIKYIFNFIFHDILKTEVGFSVSIEEFVQSTLPKFCYAPQPIGGELFFKSAQLLLEHKITAQQIRTTRFGDHKVPFAVEKSTLPFDVFAASFYFLSRYEEYLPPAQDNNLYAPLQSLQYHAGLLKLPVIDGWALLLKNILLKHFPELSFGSREFSFNPVYALPAKTKALSPIARMAGYFRSMIRRVTTNDQEKLACVHQLIVQMQQEGSIKTAQVFISPANSAAHFDAQLLLPKSYIRLIKNNTGNDYSMYYSNQPGFRAGTCSPFLWYDLQLEQTTRLIIHPVAATDLALLNNKTTEALLLQLNELLDSVKLVNGHFYFLSLYNDI
ncbi:DUF7033 domain-containing protein [Pedobacter africanus]|uniref:DUF7033 domain-containing protein n=1 Tax=Pedobacter africanus TaxID=151894 RepID=A0A1W2BMQ1_9SPHI|nr:hypothetical protein [Pedobacter africanus]SMC74093.1 hypothetical protein SAMN04488524_2482 [Pedobacter africanus]